MNTPSTGSTSTMRVYPSAVDLWLVALLAATPLICIGIGVWRWSDSVPSGVGLIAIGTAIGALIVALSVPCRYTLTERMLFIRCGVFRDEVPLAKVVRVEKSWASWSAPALSLRRVRIVLTDGSRLISPKERDRFIAEIERLAARARQG